MVMNKSSTQKLQAILLVTLLSASSLKAINILPIIPSFFGPDEIIQCKQGLLPFAWKMLAKETFALNSNNTSTTFKSECFDTTTVNFSWKDNATVKLTIDSANRNRWFCSDNLILTDIYDYKIASIFFEGRNTFEYTIQNENQRTFIEKFGLRVMPMCDSIINILPDTLLSAAGFLTHIIPKDKQTDLLKTLQAEYIRILLHKLGGKKIIERDVKKELGIDFMKEYIEDGDGFCRENSNSNSLIINWPTGGQCEHVGMFLWDQNDKDTLYVVEASASHGIVKTKIEKWYQPPLINEKTIFAVMKLSKESRQNFNATKAWAAFDKLEGLPYGDETLLFAGIDTTEGNLPQLFNGDSFVAAIFQLYKIPQLQETIDKFVTAGFNKRLNSYNLTLYQTLDEATKRGLTLTELFAVPEQADWVFGEGDNKGPRYVCSSLQAFLLKEAGVFGDIELVPQEFTPKDIWNLGIWSNDAPHSDCLVNDYHLPFCQINGKYALEADGWNSVAPYNHMNERCHLAPPLYQRKPADC